MNDRLPKSRTPLNRQVVGRRVDRLVGRRLRFNNLSIAEPLSYADRPPAGCCLFLFRLQSIGLALVQSKRPERNRIYPCISLSSEESRLCRYRLEMPGAGRILGSALTPK